MWCLHVILAFIAWNIATDSTYIVWNANYTAVGHHKVKCTLQHSVRWCQHRACTVLIYVDTDTGIVRVKCLTLARSPTQWCQPIVKLRWHLFRTLAESSAPTIKLSWLMWFTLYICKHGVQTWQRMAVHTFPCKALAFCCQQWMICCLAPYM